MYYCASAAALLASASEHKSSALVSSALLSSQQLDHKKMNPWLSPFMGIGSTLIPSLDKRVLIHFACLQQSYTVAQKTVQVFACFGKIVLVQNANIIQGPDFFVTKNTTY